MTAVHPGARAEHLIGRREAPFRTPWGEGRVVVEGARLAEVDLPLPEGPLSEALAARDTEAPSPARWSSPGSAPDPLGVWVQELEDFFVCGPRSWTADEIGLEDLDVGSFARDVYRALLEIPVGETVSYGELATLAGYPRAARAVGSAMAANPLALVIPCHRVIRADGSSGRYGKCDALKSYLLALEGAL